MGNGQAPPHLYLKFHNLIKDYFAQEKVQDKYVTVGCACPALDNSGSSNGRTLGSGPSNLGSSPSPEAKLNYFSAGVPGSGVRIPLPQPSSVARP